MTTTKYLLIIWQCNFVKKWLLHGGQNNPRSKILKELSIILQKRHPPSSPLEMKPIFMTMAYVWISVFSWCRSPWPSSFYSTCMLRKIFYNPRPICFLTELPKLPGLYWDKIKFKYNTSRVSLLYWYVELRCLCKSPLSKLYQKIISLQVNQYKKTNS